MNRFGIRYLVSILVLTLSHLAAIAGVVIHVSPDGNDANNGSSWALAKRTIGAAISAAPSNPTSPTRIFIREGVYQEWLTINAKHDLELYGGFSGTEDTSHFDPEGNDNRTGRETVIDGQKLARCLRVSDCESTRLDRLVIRNGGGSGLGAGVNVSNCTSLVMRQVTIEDCEPRGYVSGGGMCAISSTVDLQDSTIRRCASNSVGGGLYMSSGTLVAKNVLVTQCAATKGGGLYLSGVVGLLESVQMISNRASGDTTAAGGGAFLNTCSGLAVSRSLFTGNEAPVGSALVAAAGSKPTVFNCIISGNRGDGCAVLVTGQYTYVTAWHCTIADNIASLGNSAVGSADRATVLLRSSIVAYNCGPRAPFGREASAGFQLVTVYVWANSGPLFDDPYDVQTLCGGVGERDPKFLNRHYTHHPLSFHLTEGSRIIDGAPLGLNDDYAEAADLMSDPDALKPRPVAGRRYDVDPMPDGGALEYQGVQQRVQLEAWRCVTDGRPDQSAVLLQVRVWDETNRLLLDAEVPQSADGFYVLPGGWGWEKGARYSVKVKVRNYLWKALEGLIDPSDPSSGRSLQFPFPKYNSPGVGSTEHDVPVLVGGDLTGDNQVGVADLNLLMFTPWEKPTIYDIDGDGVITVTDLTVVLLNFDRRGD